MGTFQKMVVFLLAFAAAFLFHHSPVDGFNSDRIVNGSDAPLGMFQYLPAIYLGGPQKLAKDNKNVFGSCSSTIISKRHILTAAHCVYIAQKIAGSGHKLHQAFVTAKIGMVDVRPQEKNMTAVQDFGVETKIYVHPSYTAVQTLQWDIAIIEFPNGTDFGIPSVDLASNYVPKKGDKATAAGYGVYRYEADPADPNKMYEQTTIGLQYTQLSVNATPACPYQLLCAGDNLTWADHGDSGGPLMFERNEKAYQVGVLSSGAVIYSNKQFTYVFDTYMKTSVFCDWIKATTKGEAICVEMPEEAPVQPPKEETTAKNPAGNGTDDSNSTSPADEEIPTKPTPQAQVDPDDDDDTNGTRFFDAAKILFVLLGSFFMLM